MSEGIGVKGGRGGCQKSYGAFLVFVSFPVFLGRLGPCGRDEGGVGLDPRVQREQTLYNRQQRRGREVDQRHAVH